jgi:hypothetical protein
MLRFEVGYAVKSANISYGINNTYYLLKHLVFR